MKMRLLACLALLSVVAIPANASKPGGETLAELAQQVRSTETAFAKTLADRDIKAVSYTHLTLPTILRV